MGDVVRLWNLGRDAGHRPVFRKLVCFGDSMVLGPDLILRVFREVVDGDDCVTAVITSRYGIRCEHHLLPGRDLDMTRLAGVIMRPRGIVRAANDRPTKVLLEFVAVSDIAKKAFIARRG